MGPLLNGDGAHLVPPLKLTWPSRLNGLNFFGDDKYLVEEISILWLPLEWKKPGRRKPTSFKWMEMVISTHFSLYSYDLVHHPIETTILTWLYIYIYLEPQTSIY